MSEFNVWKAIYDEEATTKAQALIAAAFDGLEDPSAYISELEKVAPWLTEGTPDEIARKVVTFTSAMALLATQPLEMFGREIAAAKRAPMEPTEAQVRTIAFDLLSEYVAQVRETAEK